MEEIAPGIHHWKAFHPNIREEVSSYYIEPAEAVIDPMLPDEGLAWFESRERQPRQVILTNRHHLRRSERFAEAFGCAIRCSKPGLHEFEGGPEVIGFSFGDEVAPGITALEAGAICPDDTVLHIAVADGALAFADGLVNQGGLGFVSDRHMDDPPAVKESMRKVARRLSEREFDTLLFAHGDPVVGNGRAALRDFVEGS
jgi:hypothetical protein